MQARQCRGGLACQMAPHRDTWGSAVQHHQACTKLQAVALVWLPRFLKLVCEDHVLDRAAALPVPSSNVPAFLIQTFNFRGPREVPAAQGTTLRSVGSHLL